MLVRVAFMWAVALALLGGSACAQIVASGPNVRTFISVAIAQEVADAGVALLAEQWQAVAISDQSGTASTAVGNVDYTLSNMWIQSVSVGAVNVAFAAPSAITLTSSSLSGSMLCQWRYREAAWPHVSDSGWATIALADATLVVSLTATADATGRLVLALAAINVQVGSVTVTATGADGWVYSLLTSLLSSSVNAAAEAALESSLGSLVAAQLTALQTALSMDAPVPGTSSRVELDLALVAQPAVSPAGIVCYHLGLAVDMSAPNTPFAPSTPSLPLPLEPSTANWQTDVSVDLLNSIAAAFAALGPASVTLTEMPAGSPIKLTVDDFSQMVPQLLSFFTAEQAMTMTLTAVGAPAFTISPDGVGADSGLVAAFGVVSATDPTVVSPAYSLAIELSVGATVALSQPTGAASLALAVTVMAATPDVSVASSAIGTIDPTTSAQVLTFAIHQVLIPHVNSLLAAGIPLALPDGLTLDSPTLTLGDGFFSVAADVSLSEALLENMLGLQPPGPPPASGSS